MTLVKHAAMTPQIGPAASKAPTNMPLAEYITAAKVKMRPSRSFWASHHPSSDASPLHNSENSPSLE